MRHFEDSDYDRLQKAQAYDALKRKVSGGVVGVSFWNGLEWVDISDVDNNKLNPKIIDVI